MKEKTRPYEKRYSHRLLTVGMVSFSLVLTFSGCATTEKKAGEPAPYEKIPFSEILASPEEYKGRTVRLGGVIITTENREKETVLEILEKPLSQTGRPKSGDDSGGRFKVVFAEFLDKAIYRADRSVTIIGEITGMETAPIGEAEYNYPLLSGKEIRLWKEGGYYDWPRMHIGIGVGTGSGGTRGGVGVGTSF
jgi:outer membrane lipoprotein